ncbi:P27 family phage terminase small subunit [Weissella cibaria]|uniref:P27 family phage terminase small subunit n=1 Tax=Weissella cibaria TaxID=137591 RepID=UPI000A748E32|nr:P27 family phage terminase small subunit [Weissella cibaria]
MLNRLTIVFFNVMIVDGKKNPNVSVYENSVKNLRSLANDLGLTPASNDHKNSR